MLRHNLSTSGHIKTLCDTRWDTDVRQSKAKRPSFTTFQILRTNRLRLLIQSHDQLMGLPPIGVFLAAQCSFCLLILQLNLAHSAHSCSCFIIACFSKCFSMTWPSKIPCSILVASHVTFQESISSQTHTNRQIVMLSLEGVLGKPWRERPTASTSTLLWEPQ